jgi:hypothetical protein
MIDPVTIGTGAAGLLALDPVRKLLGPTADYLGAELAAYTKRRLTGAEKIIEIAADHVGNDAESKSVSSRVLLAALDEGSKVESDIAQRYFGGVLASSRSENGADDSAVTFTSMLATMSSSQIKLHCALYSALRLRWLGTLKSMSDEPDRHALTIAIPINEIIKAFGIPVIANLEHAMFGLHRLGLIDYFEYGSFMASSGPEGFVPFIQFKPTVLGASLFLAGHGHPANNSSDILRTDLAVKEIVAIDPAKVRRSEEIQRVDPTTKQVVR